MNQKDVKELHDGRWVLFMGMKDLILENRKTLNRLCEQLKGENDEATFAQIELLRDSYDEDLVEINRFLSGIKPAFKNEVEFLRNTANRLAEDIRGTLLMQYIVPDPAGMYSSSWVTGIQMVNAEEDPDTTRFKDAAREFGCAATEYAYATVGCGITGGYPERAFFGSEYVLDMIGELADTVAEKFEAMVSLDKGEGERASDKVYEKWGDILNETDINLYKLEFGFAEGKRKIFKTPETKKTNFEREKELSHV